VTEAQRNVSFKDIVFRDSGTGFLYLEEATIDNGPEAAIVFENFTAQNISTFHELSIISFGSFVHSGGGALIIKDSFFLDNLFSQSGHFLLVNSIMARKI